MIKEKVNFQEFKENNSRTEKVVKFQEFYIHSKSGYPRGCLDQSDIS